LYVGQTQALLGPEVAEDIFSLGVVFFQLMSARVPRSGPDRVQGIFQDIGRGRFEMSRLVESSTHGK